jgi:hypothetical protein
MNIRFAILLLTVTTIFSACKDEKEPIPAYLRLEPFAVDAGGDAVWHKLTEGWLYVNGEFLGAYTLPATVPVLAAGDSEVLLFPGVKENGITMTPNIYPFLTRHTGNHFLEPGVVTTINPTTQYDPAVVFPWGFGRGDFDGGSTIVLENQDNDPGSSFTISSVDAFNGQSIHLPVDTAHPFISITTEAVALPASYEREVWMELHYRNDIPFTMWIVGQSAGSEVFLPVYQFKPTEGFTWNKIYLNLTETLLISQGFDQYRINFQVALPSDGSLNYLQEEGRVLLDNLRLVHF